MTITTTINAYDERRGRLETYFNKTASDAWAQLTSNSPVSRIRETVRQGRDEMRGILMSWLPGDMSWSVLLDAGCGTGALSVAAARRGATVVAVDIAETLVDLARQRAPRDLAPGVIDFKVGDMLSRDLGEFTHVAAMDSLIHYPLAEIIRVLGSLAARTRGSIVFTFAPSTPLLEVALATGRLFPRSDRSPAIEPVTEARLRKAIAAHPDFAAWRVGRTARVSRGFYTSQAVGAGASMTMEATLILEALAPDVTPRGMAAFRASCRPLSTPGDRPGMPVWSWRAVGMKFLPFADGATPELPLGRMLRLSLFQFTVGMSAVLLIGTLNRVMIVELGIPAWLVATMISLPLFFAPLRMLIGHKSDHHRSVLGWRRVPYIWFGSMFQFGGLAIMPFALLLLSGDSHAPPIVGEAAAALAFLMAGAGLHTTQTAGLALATDLAPAHARPKVVALLCLMLLVGTVLAAVSFGFLLSPFSELRLIQVVQGAAALTIVLNGIALWKQEARHSRLATDDEATPSFGEAWRAYAATGRAGRRLLAIGMGTVAFSMQDVLLEPYGGKIMHLSVSATTTLTALLAVGGGCGLGLAARFLNRGADAYRVAGFGALAGLIAFASVIFAAPTGSPVLFAIGVAMVGFGAGLFAHGTLTASMAMAKGDATGLALGAWGAVQALAAGLAIATGGLISDAVSSLAVHGRLGAALATPATGYASVYLIEVVLLFLTLVAIGPLVGQRARAGSRSSSSSNQIARLGHLRPSSGSLGGANV